jgi:hypothetical protein
LHPFLFQRLPFLKSHNVACLLVLAAGGSLPRSKTGNRESMAGEGQKHDFHALTRAYLFPAVTSTRKYPPQLFEKLMSIRAAKREFQKALPQVFKGLDRLERSVLRTWDIAIRAMKGRGAGENRDQ